MSDDPRLLLIDMTSLRGSAATSMLKAAYFADWTPGRLLHLQSISKEIVGLAADFGRTDIAKAEVKLKDEILRRFQPEIILYRPVAGEDALHELAMEIIESSNAPLVLWMMDDWPARLEHDDPGTAMRMNADLEHLFGRSVVNYAISEGMAQAFQERYGAPFEVAHNGIHPADWRSVRQTVDERGEKPVCIRYSGSLAPDMTRDSVYAVAQVTAQLANAGMPVRMQISTQDAWYRENAALFRGLKNVQFRRARHDEAGYRKWLCDADILLLAYNFDEATRRYVRYSFANKTPELLASRAAVLVHGPDDLETIRFLCSRGLAHCVVSNDAGRLSEAIRSLVEDPVSRHELSENARDYVFEHMDLEVLRGQMRRQFRELAAAPTGESVPQRSEVVRDALGVKISSYRRIVNGFAERSPWLFRLLRKPARVLKGFVGSP